VLTVTGGRRNPLYHFDNTRRVPLTGSSVVTRRGAGPVPGPRRPISTGRNLKTTTKASRARRGRGHILPVRSFNTRGRRGSVPVLSTASSGCISRIQRTRSTVRAVFHLDNLTKQEIGWKTEFSRHRLQWKGGIYQKTGKCADAFFDRGAGQFGSARTDQTTDPRPRDFTHSGAVAGLTARAGVLESQRADQLTVPDCETTRHADESGDQGEFGQPY